MKALLLLVALGAPACATTAPPYQGIVQSTSTGRDTMYLSGYMKIANSSASADSPTITLDGPKGGVNASSATFTYGVNAGTGSFTGQNATGYSVITSSSINLGGCITFSNGSQQCVAGGAGASAAGIGTNNVYTGTNTFNSIVLSTPVVTVSYAITETTYTYSRGATGFVIGQDWGAPSGSNATSGPCVASSTFSFHLSQSCAAVVAHITLPAGTDSVDNILGITGLIDGQFPLNRSTNGIYRGSIFISSDNVGATGAIQTVSGEVLWLNIIAGDHKFCVAPAISTGSYILDQGFTYLMRIECLK